MSSKKSKKIEVFPLISDFSNNLSRLREEKNMKPARLEREIGITRGTWDVYEKGKSVPGLDKTILIAKYFGISLDELLGFKSKVDEHGDKKFLSQFIDRIERIANVMRTDKRGDLLRVLDGLIRIYEEAVEIPAAEKRKKGGGNSF
jgi:transcriptional regulator with XRE-family HTH domain